ncbi:MAG: hypothetical protein L0211_17240 [Planctomycetaceae bacterium]|nr:hypothetical protein [Planctomycetaceae bacterium]
MHSPFAINFRLLATLFALASVTLAGCGGQAPHRVPVYKTAGKVTFRDQPLEGAFLVLHPKAAATRDVPRPTAHVKPDGSFEPTTFLAADGAPAGEYVVTIEWRKLVNVGGEWTPGPNLLPPKYNNPATSDVIVTIAEGTNDLPTIVLR